MNNERKAIKTETVDLVEAKIRSYQNSGELSFPENYSPGNALKSAWLILQSTVDKDKRPVLDVCTRDSIANALLSMVIQGLNPDKKQLYFIAYGRSLVMQRSYFGAIAVAKRVDPEIVDVYPDVVYANDKFRYAKKFGITTILSHEQELGNIDRKKIVAAYATILYKDGHEVSTVMTMDEIKQSWEKSQVHPVDNKGELKPGTTHEQYTADMCRRTVVNKACKYVINSSDDSDLVVQFARRSDAAEAEALHEIEENANSEPIDAEYTDVDPDTGEVTTPPPEPPDDLQGTISGMDAESAPPPEEPAPKKGRGSKAKADDPF